MQRYTLVFCFTHFTLFKWCKINKTDNHRGITNFLHFLNATYCLNPDKRGTYVIQSNHLFGISVWYLLSFTHSEIILLGILRIPTFFISLKRKKGGKRRKINGWIKNSSLSYGDICFNVITSYSLPSFCHSIVSKPFSSFNLFFLVSLWFLVFYYFY